VSVFSWFYQKSRLWFRSGYDSDGSVLVTIGGACDSVRFGAGDDEYLALVCNRIVRNQLDKRAITYETYKAWRAKNPLIFAPVVTDRNELVGFFDVFPLYPDFGEQFISGTLDEHSLLIDGIVPLAEISSAKYLHIATIMINPWQRAFSPLVARETLLLKLKEFLEIHYNPVSSRNYTAYAQTGAGEALLKRAGFSLAVFPENNAQHRPLYVLRSSNTQNALVRFDRAGECVARMYKRALRIDDFDSRIEGVELKLRQLIENVLDNDATLLPQHVKNKVEDRIQAAKKKDPTFDNKRLLKLSGRLEYADLRELEETIMAKSLWGEFQSKFINKETTMHKFSQIAELRNFIRHSRQLNIIVQKEGEAGILWFEEVLRSNQLAEK
jgi:hypothetical protein